MKIVKKILLGLLIAIVAVAVIAGVVIAVYAPRNVKAMNSAVDTFIDAIGKEYAVTEVDCGEYSTMTVSGVMKFNVSQYDVEDIGNLSVMTVNIGLMQMATAVLTPADRDIPLVSMDYMYMLGIRTCYLEFYDLVLDKEGAYAELLSSLENVKAQYADLVDVTPTAAWYDELKTVGIYKSGSTSNDEELSRILSDSLEVVTAYAKTLPALAGDDRAQKIALQKSYSNGLIENGGVSTDAFLTSFGADATRTFFDKVLFKAE